MLHSVVVAFHHRSVCIYTTNSVPDSFHDLFSFFNNSHSLSVLPVAFSHSPVFAVVILLQCSLVVISPVGGLGGYLPLPSPQIYYSSFVWLATLSTSLHLYESLRSLLKNKQILNKIVAIVLKLHNFYYDLSVLCATKAWLSK